MFFRKITPLIIGVTLGLSTIMPVALTRAVNADSINLVANPSVETPDPTNGSAPQYWLQGGWGTNSAAFSYLNTGHSGNHSVEVKMNSYSSGDAKWYFAPIAAQPGAQYDFTDYYEANVTSDVVVQFGSTNGSYSYLDLGNAPASVSWSQYHALFTAPASTANVTVFHLINRIGYLITDDYSLTPPSASTAPTVSMTAPTANATLTGVVSLSANASAPDGIANVQFKLDSQNIGNAVTSAPYQLNWDSSTVSNGTHNLTAVAAGTDGTTTSSPISIFVSNTSPSGGNLVPNAKLDTTSSADPSMPLNWHHDAWGTNQETFSYLSSGYNDGRSVSVQMTGYSSGDAKWWFDPVAVSPDTQYRFSEYYKSTVQTAVMAVFNMSDGSTLYQYIGLPDTANNWTQFSTGFSAPLGATNMTIYHLIRAVGSLTTDDFSLASYTPTGFNRPLLSLTFDDGYASTYKYGLPLFKSNGFNSTQFIITNLVGQSNYMTKANVQNLYKNGQEVASHTVSHSDLTQESPSTLTRELANSQSSLQKWIGAPVTDLAYPYGLYNTAVLNKTATYYTGARGVENALNSKDNFNQYDIKVQNIFDNTTTAQIADWVHQAQTTKTWLVLVYHSVDPPGSPMDGDPYNVTPTQLADQLTAIKSSGITVETMQTALTEVKAQL